MPNLSQLKAKLGTVPPHLVIIARAGTGKTTTLVNGMFVLKGMKPQVVPSEQQHRIWDAIKKSPANSSVAFMAFNAAIVEELKKRVPSGARVSTMHSAGKSIVCSHYGRVEVEPNRVDFTIAELLGEELPEIRRSKFPLLSLTKRLVGLCKNNLVDWESDDFEEVLRGLVVHHEIELEDWADEVYALVPQVLEASMYVDRDLRMDYDDMIWLPLILDLPAVKTDILFVDEVQDLNPAQQQLAYKIGRRLVLCGDPKQAIYGFAGADTNSIPRMIEHLKTTTNGVEVLDLTVTRRCGKAIVEEAKKLVPDFEAFEGNGEGLISRSSFDVCTVSNSEGERVQQSYHDLVEPGDMILCRTNGPLVSQCFAFIKRGKKATIRGRSIGQDLIRLIDKMRAKTVPELIEKINTYTEKQTAKERAKPNPSESKIINLQDRRDCILCFTEECDYVAEVKEQINKLFTDNGVSEIVLSTIHKAKGLESFRVFLLEPKGASVPHPMATSPWQVEQEYNLRYIAITRAIHELVFVR